MFIKTSRGEQCDAGEEKNTLDRMISKLNVSK